MIVVDSNVITCLCLPGDHTAKAESVCGWSRLRSRIPDPAIRVLDVFRHPIDGLR